MSLVTINCTNVILNNEQRDCYINEQRDCYINDTDSVTCTVHLAAVHGGVWSLMPLSIKECPIKYRTETSLTRRSLL